MDAPNLIEPGAKHFFNTILENCHKTRLKYNTIMINGGLFLLFIVSLYIFLKYKKNTKYNKETIKEEQEREKKNYILKKLTIFNKNKYEKRQQLITNLPPINNDIY